MPQISVHVSTKGPLFKPGSSRLVALAAERAVQELMELGEQRLDETLRPRPACVFLSVSEAKKGQASTGNYRRNVGGKRTGLEALITDGGVVYGPWLEGTGDRNATTRFKGYFSFRRTAQWLQGQSRRVMEWHVSRLAKELGA